MEGLIHASVNKKDSLGGTGSLSKTVGQLGRLTEKNVQLKLFKLPRSV